MENQAKIRINLDTKEMEIQGSEAFINSHSAQIQKFLESQTVQPSKKRPGRPPKAASTETAEKTTKKTGKKRGRPRKSEAEKKSSATATATKRKTRKTTKIKTKASTATSKKDQLEKRLAKVTQEDIDQIRKELPARFGDFFLKLPKGTKDVDKVLAGGFFVQNKGENNTFSTRETTRLLKTVGVKLSNPSQCVKYNDKTGRIKNVRRNRYRLTPDGEKYIVLLLKNQVV